VDKRDEGIAEIKDRLKVRKDVIGLVFFKDTPSGEIDPENTPSVLMLEGNDRIVKPSTRNNSGYPATRAAEITLECIVNSKDTSPRMFCKDVRKAIFLDKEADFLTTNESDINIHVAEGVFIREDRTEGPFGYGLPNINGMRLVIDLVYDDNIL